MSAVRWECGSARGIPDAVRAGETGAVMDRYVSQDISGWTELRVHGVSGTPPETELCHPAVALVAGDRLAGFYRRIWECARGAPDGPDFRREGYAWGKLTSGDNSRALWLLLLPFMFLNLAYYMDPGHRVVGGHTRVVPERNAVQRLLALSLTGTYVLAATSVSMDLVAWQCGAHTGPSQPTCSSGGFWLNWLHYGWLDSTGRHLAVASIVPLALVGLLWWTARRTWATMEAQQVPQVDRVADVRLPLEDRRLWNGRGPVRKLRALHVAGALALVGVLLLAPLLPGADLTTLSHGGTWHPAAAVVRNLLLLALLLVVALVVAWVPLVKDRDRPGQDAPRTDDDGDLYRILPWLVAALVACALAVACWGAANAGPTDTTAGTTALPWQTGAVRWLLIAQGALLVLLAASHVVRGTARTTPADRDVLGNPGFPRPAWGGMSMAGVALLATLLATALAAGVTLRVAEMLGAPTVPGHSTGDQRPLVVSIVYFWAAVCALALVVVALLLAARAWAGMRRGRAEQLHHVEAFYPPGDVRTAPRGRRRHIAGVWARARGLGPAAESALGLLLLAAAVIVAAGVALDLALGTRLVTDGSRWLTTAANLVLTGLVAGLLWAGRQAYRNESFRRTVGILWDVGTFWPRATHPFAPPCYAERTVPDLLTRLEHLTGTTGEHREHREHPEPQEPQIPRGGRVLLSCHSQGSVIGAAVLMQANTAAGVRTALLTYGCPLTGLYARFFPAYFDAGAVHRLGQLLAHEEGELPAPGEDPGLAKDTRWYNLYRASDPIGGWVVRDTAPLRPGDPLRRGDRQLLDPMKLCKQPGDTCYQPPKGHSDYFSDPAFDACVRDLVGGGTGPRLIAPPPTAVPVVLSESVDGAAPVTQARL
ncbi:hypothetical protein ACH4U3_20105 [Streptomyces griseoruber]|uniref:hypothetical protein n=1 Tax=Streptomyces griseoruber TaxID=1943 RepID=UPI0037BDDA14